MRTAIRRALTLGLILVGAIASCGKDSGTPAAPHPVTGESTRANPASGTGSSETGESEAEPRVSLEAEFHRTRYGLGTGIWVLGMVHNAHAERVSDVQPRVVLLDAAEQIVGRADGRLGRGLGPGERAAVAVHIERPIAHDQLRLEATAIVDEGSTPEPLTLRLEHEPPQPADFGGWYILGKIENTGSAAIEGARVEIQGLDASGKLLGIDWLALDPVPPGATVEFDVGGLRYEETPAGFVLEPRGPASD